MADDLLLDAAVRSRRYLDSLDVRPVRPLPDGIEELARFNEPLSDEPRDAAETLRLLDEIGSSATMAMAGPRFFGFVIGARSWLPLRRTG
jgi:hypothetical protein